MTSRQALEYRDFWSSTLASGLAPTDAEQLRTMFKVFGQQAAPLDPATRIEPVNAAGVPALWVIPADAQALVIVWFHGGGYVMGSAETHAPVAGHLAQRMKARALVVDYGLAPENPHPGPVEDCLKAYQWLLHTGVDPANVVFVGESAGGALVITTQLLAKRRGVPLPAAAASLSPWIEIDPTDERLMPYTTFFLKDPQDAQDALVNPLAGDLAGLGPLFVQVGGAEAEDGAVDQALALVKTARAAGVSTADCDVVPDMLHMFQLCAGRMPEADAALDRIASFLLDVTTAG